jgi:HAD superfamily hydrolase (TIGR01450 family)
VSLLERYDAFLFDLDGTIYRGESPIARAVEAVSAVRAAGKGLAFMTNNSYATRAQVASRLGGIGVQAGAEEIVTSAAATAGFLAEQGIASAWVLGGPGVIEELGAAGIRLADDGEADSVVIGWDPGTDYGKLREASLRVAGGARLIATNDDAAFPAADGLWPGAGALLAAVTTTTGAEATVIGKPHPRLCTLALRSAGGGRPILIGDRLETDIAAAEGLGWDSLLVLSGVSRRQDLSASRWKPTWVADDAGGLLADPERA